MWSSGATLLALLLVFVRPALGDACVLTGGSLYQLKSDAVYQTARTDSGQSCIRGLRHNRVTIDTAKLISPPQSGQVKLLGSGFSYTAKSDFEGQDSFTIQVSGMSNGISPTAIGASRMALMRPSICASHSLRALLASPSGVPTSA